MVRVGRTVATGALALTMLFACSSRPSFSPNTQPATVPMARPPIDDAFALGLRHALESNPDGPGSLPANATVADGLFEVTASYYVAQGEVAALTAGQRAAAEREVAPTVITWVAPGELDSGLRVGLSNEMSEAGPVVAWEFVCGDPGALCGSGGAVRLEARDGRWTVAERLSSWIS